jgi:hypothetical protein
MPYSPDHAFLTSCHYRRIIHTTLYYLLSVLYRRFFNIPGEIHEEIQSRWAVRKKQSQNPEQEIDAFTNRIKNKIFFFFQTQHGLFDILMLRQQGQLLFSNIIKIEDLFYLPSFHISPLSRCFRQRPSSLSCKEFGQKCYLIQELSTQCSLCQIQ